MPGDVDVHPVSRSSVGPRTEACGAPKFKSSFIGHRREHKVRPRNILRCLPGFARLELYPQLWDLGGEPSGNRQAVSGDENFYEVDRDGNLKKI